MDPSRTGPIEGKPAGRLARKLKSCCRKHPEAREPLLHWYRVTKRASWSNPAEVRTDFRHADFVSKHTVFNIAGNRYRLIAGVNYQWRIVYIRRILTLAEHGEGGWKR